MGEFGIMEGVIEEIGEDYGLIQGMDGRAYIFHPDGMVPDCPYHALRRHHRVKFEIEQPSRDAVPGRVRHVLVTAGEFAEGC
jgi:hypothetical protein